MKNTTFSKEQILSRLEKSNPEQLEARLEMKGSSFNWLKRLFGYGFLR